MNQTVYRGIFLTVAALATACDSADITRGKSSVSSEIPEDATTRHVASITAIQDDNYGTDSTRINASFSRLEVDASVIWLMDYFSPSAHSESCTIASLYENPQQSEEFVTQDPDPIPISAGESVLVLSGNTEFAQLYMDFDGVYRQAGDIDRAIPDNLSVSYPGHDIPSADNISFPNVVRLSNVWPDLIEEVNIDTEFSWTAHTVPHSKVDIAMMANNGQIIYCTAQDDGVFQLPAGIVSELGDNPVFSFVLLSRRSASFTFENDVLIKTEVVPVPVTIGDGEEYIVNDGLPE